MTVKKYFLAIVIPEPIFSKIEIIKQDLLLRYNLKGALRSPSHITLHRPFIWKEEKEDMLIEKLGAFSFESEFHVELNGFSFFEPRVVFVNVKENQELLKLQVKLKNYAKKELHVLNEVNDLRGFYPHVTIASRDLKKAKFYELQEEFKCKVFNESFLFSSFSLLKFEKKWEVLNNYVAKRD